MITWLVGFIVDSFIRSQPTNFYSGISEKDVRPYGAREHLAFIDVSRRGSANFDNKVEDLKISILCGRLFWNTLEMMYFRVISQWLFLRFSKDFCSKLRV